MGGSQKSKRVTWPSDDNLCQVRLFLSEDSPAQVGFGSQDHLQAKTWPSHSNVSDDNLPPGFEGTQPANLIWNKLPQIPLIKWRCPSRFSLDEAWRVAAGEESTELEIENNRVKRVLEAIYPRESAIPPDPSDAVGLENSFANDKPPLLIPITPIEDEDAPAAADGFADSVVMNPPPVSLHSQPAAPLASSSHYALTTNPPAQGVSTTEAILGVDPAVVSAANAALSAVMSNNNQGNLIDRDLLIKILSDPKMVEQLVKNHGASTSPQILPPTSAQNVPMVGVHTMVSTSTHSLPDTKVYSMPSTTTHGMPVTRVQNRPGPTTPRISFSDPSPIPVGRTDQHVLHVNRAEFAAAPLTTSSSGAFYPPGRISPLPNPRSPAPVPDMIPAPSQTVTKDINYYKSLIQQHGGDRQETAPQYSSRSNHHVLPVREPTNNPRSRDLKHKIMKPCIYYNTSRGCRNGANCAYQHDESAQQRVSGLPDSQSTKRMKMDREITGT